MAAFYRYFFPLACDIIFVYRVYCIAGDGGPYGAFSVRIRFRTEADDKRLRFESAIVVGRVRPFLLV